MELKDFLLPLVAESRRRYADNSLMIVIESIQTNIKNATPSSVHSNRQFQLSDLTNRELLLFSSGHTEIRGYGGEIRHWQTQPCSDLHQMVLSMTDIGILSMQPLKTLQKVLCWKEKNKRNTQNPGLTLVYCEFMDIDNHFVLDDELLTVLEEVLRAHFCVQRCPFADQIQWLALPIIVPHLLWVVLQTDLEQNTVDMQLYDSEGCKCGNVTGIVFTKEIPLIVGRCLKGENMTMQRIRGNSKVASTAGLAHEKPSADVGLNNLIFAPTNTAESKTSSSAENHMICTEKETAAEPLRYKAVLNKRIWELVRKIAKTSSADHSATFVSLGFDSLKLARLEFALQAEFSGNFSLPYGIMQRFSTVDALSDYLSTKSGAEITGRDNIVQESESMKAVDEKLKKLMRNNEKLMLSAAQKRFVFLSELISDGNGNFLERMSFKIDKSAMNELRKALNRLVARHTALRTIYTRSNQIILSSTEAYFWIRLQQDIDLEGHCPIRLFDSTVPMQILIASKSESRTIKNHCQENPKVVKGVSQKQLAITREKFETKSIQSEESEYSRTARTTDRCIVMIEQHHIMTDGFSVKLLRDDLRTLCSRKKQIEPAIYQYAHYVLLEDQIRRNSEHFEFRKKFWKNQFARVELQTLPADKTDQTTGLYSNGCVQVKLDYKTQKYLQNTAESCSVTQFTVLLGMYQLLHYKKFGIQDLCIGVVSADRGTPELQTIVGCLLNVVPVICTIHSEEKICDFIKKASRRLSECTQNQIPFDDLIAVLNAKRSKPNSPLFQVLFIMDEFSVSDDDASNSDIDNSDSGNDEETNDKRVAVFGEFESQDSNFAQYDQVWYCQRREIDTITIKVVYNANLFYATSVKATVQQYIRLIHKIHGNLHTPVSNLKLISNEEEYRNYQKRVSNRCDFPRKCTALDIIAEQNRMNRYCNKIIQQNSSFSSSFLEKTSNRLSRHLTQLWLRFSGENLATDNFALVHLSRSVDLLLVVFSLWKCGAAVAPVSTDIPEKQLHETATKLNPFIIIHGFIQNQSRCEKCNCRSNKENCSENASQMLPLLNGGKVFSRQDPKCRCSFQLSIESSQMRSAICEYSDKELRKKASERDLAYLTFTSGSTGAPKAICTEFYGLNNLALNYAEQLSIRRSSIIYQVVNPSFDIFFADLIEAHTNGATLHLAAQSIPDLTEEITQVSHAYIMPAYLSAIKQKHWEKLARLEKLNFGGDHIQHKSLHAAVQAGLHSCQQYGLTEHSIYSTCKLMKIREKVSLVGKPLKNIHFFVRDVDRNICEHRVIGTCCTSGPGISRGYFGNSLLNRQLFLENHDLAKLELLTIHEKHDFWTGDMAVIENAAGELNFLGRKDFEVKIRGMRINVSETEAALEQCELVKACVVCVHGTNAERFLTAYIILSKSIQRTEDDTELKTALSNYLASKLPSIMIPSQFVFLLQFPLNTNGKIDRKRLPVPQKLANPNTIARTQHILTPWQKKVMEIFANLLPGKAAEPDQSFFELGGDSLKAMLAMQQINQELGVNLHLRDIFQSESFSAIMDLIAIDFSKAESRNFDNAVLCQKPKKFHNHYDDVRDTGESAMPDIPKAKASKICNKTRNKGKTRNKFWLDEKGIPVSLLQDWLLFLYSFGQAYRDSYMLRFLIKFYGTINLKKLNSALNFVVRKHPVLRTIILRKADRTVQETLSLAECYIKIGENNSLYKQAGPKTGCLPELFDNPLLTIISDSVSGNLQLHLIFDHLIVDGHSIAILSNDLVEIYNKLLTESSEKCFHASTDVRRSYANFCLQQRRQAEKLGMHGLSNAQRNTEQKVQDCRLLDEMIAKLQKFPALEIASNCTSAADDDFDIRNDSMKLKISVTPKAISEFCAAQNCTLFAYLLSIFSLTMRLILAEQHSPQEQRFAVVTPVLNRTQDTMNCTGLFTNTVIIAIETNFQQISHLIQNIQAIIAEALHYQHIPFGYVIQKLNPRRDPSRTSPYPISFVVHSASAKKLPRIDGVETVVEELVPNNAKFDQSWYFTKFQDYVEMMVEYRVAKYSSSMIGRSMELFDRIAYEILSKHEVDSILKICASQANKKKEVQNFEHCEDRYEITKNGKENETTTKILENVLLKIWKEVLSDPGISTSDNFFAKGGHSLLFANVCYKIEKELGYKCPPQAIFRYQTIRELAENLSNSLNMKSVADATKFRLKVCPLQESLVRLYHNCIAQSEAAAATTKNITTTYDQIKAFQTGFTVFLESLNLLQLRKALNAVIMRHSALRTTFYHQDDHFFQQLHSGTEIYFSSRETEEQTKMNPPNPFHAIPILCWLTRNGGQEKPIAAHSFKLHFQISHAVCDGKSMAILASELRAIYFTDIQILGKTQDYVRFTEQIEQRFSSRTVEVNSYWRKALEKAESVDLYPDKVVDSRSNKCKIIRKNFQKLNTVIKKLATKYACSMFAVQVAAFCKVLFGRVQPEATATSAASKLLVSCVVDMRYPGEQDCVGMCINTLPLVVDVENNSTRDLVCGAARSLAAAYLNADISTSDIEKSCGNVRWHKLMIVDDNVGVESDHLNNDHEGGDDPEYTKCDLTLFLTHHQNHISAKIEYKQEFFYSETVAIMLDNWAKTILNMKLSADAEDRIIKHTDRPKLGPERRLCPSFAEKSKRHKKQPIFDSSDFPSFSFPQLLHEALKNNDSPAKTNICLAGTKEAIDSIGLCKRIYKTSKMLNEKIKQITGAPLRPDTVVPVVAQKNISTLITCLAVTCSGAAYLPIDSTDPAKRIADILAQNRATFFVTVNNAAQDGGTEFTGRTESINSLVHDALEIQIRYTEADDRQLKKYALQLQNRSSDLAYIIFTSGTTGMPKGVAISQQGLLNMATACTRNFWMKPTDSVYQFTNFTFDNSILETTMALVNSCTLYVKENLFTKHEFFNEVKRARITHALLFPGLVKTFTEEEIRKLAFLRYWITGAESANKCTLDCALKSGVNVIQNYGPTETTAYALTKRMKLLDRPNNIGRAIDNVAATISSASGQEMLSKATIGELLISGVGVMRGYVSGAQVNDKTVTQESQCEAEAGSYGIVKHYGLTRASNCYATGDIVLVQPNNDLLFLGRHDDQVKIRGFRIELAEVEAILCQHPLIRSVKVILEQTQRQHLVAYVILRDMERKMDTHAVRRFLMKRLPHYMVPAEYHCLRQLPLTKNSKIDFAALKNLTNANANEVHRELVKPENSMEEKLLGFFQKILCNNKISVTDDFFEQGGNSLIASQLIELIVADKILSHFDVSNVFRYRTVRKLAECILDARKSILDVHNTETAHTKRMRYDDMPLSFQQQHYRFLNETHRRQYYELIFVQKFDAPKSIRHLRLAFLRLVLRQPSLRTIFPEEQYEARQEILSGTEAYFYSDTQEQYESYPTGTVEEKIRMLQNEKLDLQQEPPVLCTIQVASDTTKIAILRISHIISDAWSTKILEKELTQLYQQVLRSKIFTDTKLKLTYAEYSAEQFQRQHLLEASAAKYAGKLVAWVKSHTNYNNIMENWKERAGPRVHEFGRTCVSTILGSECMEYEENLKFSISGSYWEIGFTNEKSHIEKICRCFNCTPFVVFLGVFALAVHELSVTENLIVQVPFANRTPQTLNIIGNFLNYMLIHSTYTSEIFPTTEIAGSSVGGNTVHDEGLEVRSKLNLRLTDFFERVKETIDEVRQFEEVPFIVLLEFIKKELKKHRLLKREIVERLHRTIFFNCRYDLEQDNESTIGEGETQAPTGCVHDIEVDVDCTDHHYSCRIRVEKKSSNGTFILELQQRMLFYLQQMFLSPAENMTEKLTNSEEKANVESQLRRIWSECIGTKRFKGDDDFFMEGGNSLLTLKLARCIKKEMNISMSVDEIFENSVFSQMTEFLQKRCSGRESVSSNLPHSTPTAERKGTTIADGENSVLNLRESAEAHDNKLNVNVKADVENLRTVVVQLHHGDSLGQQNTGAIIVFFHALIGGVKWTYSSLARYLVTKLPHQFRIIGVEHPDSFAQKTTDRKLYRSIECLCSKYAEELYAHLQPANLRIFVGASFGALLAYQCAVRLRSLGLEIHEIISIDGTGRWRDKPFSSGITYEQHRQQIMEIVNRWTVDEQTDGVILEAMIDNAWELLKMMRIYIPNECESTPYRLHVTLLKAQSEAEWEDDDDYGWNELCDTTVLKIPYSHVTMFERHNADDLSDIVARAILTAKKRIIAQCNHQLRHVAS
ncbi:unnamed protein product [Gongylonema pulchrum]|uniref:oleoyl-[acyl-carrier-protein] hydrolase n=1 Tax=Gongylonema pulchrum TaxID=637853 RepID=A0A183CU81_9BILA|nr:unnamed protein product [Gongylonema pulchrum]